MMQQTSDATLLVVEDDTDTREFFAELLQLSGYQVHTAAFGQAALDVLARHTVNMIVLDRRLPDMDGLDVCRTIRATLDATVPILLVTGDYSPELQDAARAAGVNGYLSKPFLPELLLERITTLMRG